MYASYLVVVVMAIGIGEIVMANRHLKDCDA